jgi:hypothetical protein
MYSFVSEVAEDTKVDRLNNTNEIKLIWRPLYPFACPGPQISAVNDGGRLSTFIY